ncbi:tRNA glutamyl-Q(34) synthetase GluQRS [Bifidobacterium biavatii]|uniref:Glutamyl-Q tRNA(Asp) synthetase n=1 Tax=Bifidobacterium biavatii DSM 23969 TaxID=1437608 RepID=A0A087A2V9_9BIFI|nr:tRNA glutamyl-Q(34) synthetase GluQRS [Bifidobacterium biavatii]KFI53109.1 glutamyl-Q tRNA(Asp) synthetase [Bifidobacterium biavatii DSM 23969]
MTGRFAPTPSGRMHIGNIYAMFGAWLSASSRGDGVILRIEDIDRPRVRPDADRWIMDDLHWLGLDWTGEPVYQSQRLDRYEEALRVLRDADLVYPCFCSRADIRAASAPQEGDGFVVYPGTCRRLWQADPDESWRRADAGARHSLRLVAPDVSVAFNDRVFGAQSFNLARDLGDTVMRRADGLFAYQLAVTVDDLDMGVTDIVRGRDLLRSTALQLYIRDRLVSLGFGSAGGERNDVPSFAHLPLIDNAAGRRLAKRERSLDMGTLRGEGLSPEQIIGYCARLLGLSDASANDADDPFGTPMSLDEALERFSWNRVRSNLADRRTELG